MTVFERKDGLFLCEYFEAGMVSGLMSAGIASNGFVPKSGGLRPAKGNIFPLLPHSQKGQIL